jgi:hypothetical protein
MWFKRNAAPEPKAVPAPFGDTSVLDGVYNQDGVAVLLLGQVDEWGAPEVYLPAIREKMSAYVAYAADGRLAASYPELADAPVKVVIWCQQPPPEPLKDWVSELRPVLLQEHPGMVVEFQLSPSATA